MNILIPMAGSGKRFVDAGYTDPKPLIKVGGRCVVEYVCDMFDKDNDNFVFVCNATHLGTSNMIDIIDDTVRNYVIVPIDEHKLGPVYTVLAAEDIIDDDSPLVISYCDTPVKWDYASFKRYVSDKDGCVVSHTGFHPHTLSSTMFAYSKTDTDNRVLEIKEKACYTDNRFNEHASSGTYYFKHGAYVKKYFKRAISDNVNYNGEFYVTLVYNLLINDGLSVYSYLNNEVLSFGTPSEVENYEAWQTILKGGQVKNADNLVDCYNYWRRLK